MRYTHLYTTTNFTFLTGASHPDEYVYRAHELGYDAIAIADEWSLAGIVTAFGAGDHLGITLMMGSRLVLASGMQLLAVAPSRTAYAELSRFVSPARRRADKGA